MKLPSFRTTLEPKPSPAETPAPLEPIRLILPNEDVSGWVQSRGERVSDLLQAGTPLWVQPVGSDTEEWRPIEPGEVLLVVPPPHISPPERRAQRQLHEVIILIGGWVVTGTAHLMPGEEYDPYLRSTRQFLPLTNATLGTQEEQVEAFDTVIVNLKLIDEFRVL